VIDWPTEIAVMGLIKTAMAEGDVERASPADEPIALILAIMFALAVVAPLMWWRVQRGAGRWREWHRRQYTDDRLPLLLRRSASLVPLASPAMLILFSPVFLPREAAAWLSVPLFALLLIAFVLPYLRPKALLAPWLRQEIEAGITPLARPDRGDWLLFAVVVPLFVVCMVLLPPFILIYGVAGS
jgi:hypothetical protein